MKSGSHRPEKSYIDDWYQTIIGRNSVKRRICSVKREEEEQGRRRKWRRRRRRRKRRRKRRW